MRPRAENQPNNRPASRLGRRRPSPRPSKPRQLCTPHRKAHGIYSRRTKRKRSIPEEALWSELEPGPCRSFIRGHGDNVPLSGGPSTGKCPSRRVQTTTGTAGGGVRGRVKD
ncbi:hypothetical protein NDU88_001576 [Pleurodeles waltl]|uniref:Uncharacterized protein n=1 Tax=Pleurodeles waltl TaxID=8319 RepID=A0AAV7SDA4_PLEWA|nr:hypothetical protein NDU88_001576 [Pleurodeles waltl]